MAGSGGNLLIARYDQHQNQNLAFRSSSGQSTTAASMDHRLEFAKFCKFFTIRLVQAIVQSRTGRKIRTPSRALGQPTDWFNVSLDEIPEISDELKRALDGKYLASINNDDNTTVHTICLLISLKTIDGDTLHLENWQLSLNTEQCEPTVSVRSHVYHRMSVLLRSAIAASRVTPTYKLYARRQGPETFVIRYQISSAPVQLSILGRDAKTINLGFVTSPFGTVNMQVNYRTKMVISSDKSILMSTIVKENYFDAGKERSTSPRKSPTTTTDILKDAMENRDERRLSGDLPWAPLPEPSSFKALPPLPDFSPCFSTFSTSPLSGDFPFSPSPIRRPSGGVAFQLGGATSCSSSEEGGSGSHGHFIGPSSGGISTAGPLVPIRTSMEGTIPKRNSSGTLFKMELSGAGTSVAAVGVGQGGSTSPKPSSFPDHSLSGFRFPPRGSLTSATATIHRDTSFPFAHLLSSYSAPNFGGGFGITGSPIVGQFQLQHHGSYAGAIGHGIHGSASTSTALCRYSPKRRAVTAVMEEQPGLSDENLESSREVMIADGVKIIEKRKTKKSKKKNGQSTSNNGNNGGNGDGDGDNEKESETESVSSCDDSFVRYEMRPVFANGSDLGAFFNQCKSAPPNLKSFTPIPATATAAAAPIQSTIQSPTRAESMPPTVGSTSGAGEGVAMYKSPISTSQMVGLRNSLETIPETLKIYEEKQKLFDEFVKSLKVDGSSSEGEDEQQK